MMKVIGLTIIEALSIAQVLLMIHEFSLNIQARDEIIQHSPGLIVQQITSYDHSDQCAATA